MKNVLLSPSYIKLLALGFIAFISFDASAQKTEVGLSFNSGLFSYKGKTADNYSFINSISANQGYTNNPYGSNSGFSYGASANLKHIGKKNLILGLDLGFETLKSKIILHSTSNEAIGQTYLVQHSINTFPFIGHRFINQNLALDLIGGVDLGYCLNLKDKGSAEGFSIASIDRKNIDFDIRPRIQLVANYQKINLYGGYSYGITNYLGKRLGGTNDASSSMIRFGIGYRIF